jgi:hypothetical protein
MSGTKHDTGKSRLSLIPREALFGMGDALGYGERKYGTDNYKKGIAYSRLADAAMRHLAQFMSNEDIDSESGNNHLYHALASLSMLVYMYHNKPQMDDRFKED